MTAGTVSALRHAAAAKMAKVSEMYDVTWEDMRDKMRKWREENYRNSEQIVDVGEELINEYASKLGDDIWIIYEQVMIAALDCSRDDLALGLLKKTFTKLLTEPVLKDQL